MKYTKLGKSDLNVSRVCMGCMGFGNAATGTEISLARPLTKVAVPVGGATKLSHVDGAARAVDLELTADEAAFLEEPYVPHALVGVMAQNGKQKAGNVV